MATYAALVSLAKLTDLDRYRGNNLFSIEAENKVRSIHEYALYLQSFLEDFPQKAKRWEKRIRDLSHEAEDCIEDFVWLRTQTHHQGKAPQTLQQQLQYVSEKLGLIAGDVIYERPSYLPAAIPSSSSSSRLAAAGNDTVIGLENDVTIIRYRLCRELSSNLHVIPIVGMGGIGKTTLARTVYDHPSISEHFDFRAWITVSQDYSLSKIVLGLLESTSMLEEIALRNNGVDEEGSEDLYYKQSKEINMSELERKVFRSLKHRRYLIVMDDVWSTKVLNDVMSIFPDDGCGSRIMLTTRLLNVATYPDSNCPLHEMVVMTDAQSWNLLKKKVFKNGDCLPHLEDIGKEIARRCAGLPLAVVVVAGLLSTVNKSRASWKEIAKTVNSIIGKELEGILALSYTNLPHHLRPCFLYFGGFPEDEDINASRIIKLWEAEGFLKYENGNDETLAEKYLEDLVERNLVIVNSRKINGKIRSCSLHDMVRDLCTRKAMEENFLRVIEGPTRLDSKDTMDERRLSLRHPSIDCLLVPTLRTILSFNLEHFAVLLQFLGRFRLLRVLHDASINPQEFSSQVFNLIHLRYLALDRFNVTSDISKLVNLETLIIHPTFGQKKREWRDYKRDAFRLALPSEIWRMQQLKHLIFYDFYTLPYIPDSNLPLTNLQTLSVIENLVWSEKMVQMIPNVKKLGLVYSTHQEYHLHHLKYLLKLEKLQVYGCWSLFWRGQDRCFSTTLKKLSLVGGGFPWADMSIIGSLPNLQVLKLRDYACIGETWETGDDEFAQLLVLVIETSCLREWTMQRGSFPKLERLVLRSCWDLVKIPDEIGEISSLGLIEVKDCRMSVGKSAEEMKVYQLSCGNDALQVRCIGLGRTWDSRLNEIHQEGGLQAERSWRNAANAKPITKTNFE